MKKLFMFALVFAFVGFANAQEKTTKGKHAVKTERKNNFDEWSTAVGLTDAQKTEIQGIQAKYEEKRSSMRQSGTAQDFKNLNDERQKEIEKLLTPEQMKKQEAFNQRKNEEKEQKAAMKSSK